MKRTTKWIDEFLGHRVYSATAGSNVGHNWKITDTSSAGTVTHVPVAEGPGVVIDLEATAEAQNVCLSWGDVMSLDINDLIEVRFRLKTNEATLDSTTSIAVGLASERNDAIDTIAEQALFRLIGSNAIVVETDDGTVNNDDVATGKTLSTTSKDLVISFACGLADVRFFVDGEPVAVGTTFDMSNYAGGLQPYLQIQKTSDTNADGVTLEYVEIVKRAA